MLFVIEKIFKRNDSYNSHSDELTHHLKLTETKHHNALQKYAYSIFKCFCPMRTVWKLIAHDITRNSSSIICNGIKCKVRIVPLFSFQFSTHILIFSRCKYSIWKSNFWPITIAFVNLRCMIYTVFENLMPNLPWLYPLYMALGFLSMNSVRRYYSLYQSHFSPLRNLRRQKRTNISLSCIAEPILPINCVTIGLVWYTNISLNMYLRDTIGLFR